MKRDLSSALGPEQRHGAGCRVEQHVVVGAAGAQRVDGRVLQDEQRVPSASTAIATATATVATAPVTSTASGPVATLRRRRL